MSDQREMSLRLYDILEMVGASEKMRRLHQRTATARELLIGLPHSSETYTYNCGSSFEGTFTPDLVSDVDLIFCLREPLVVPHRLNAGPGWFFHMVRDEWTPPGYVKLQLVFNGRPLTVYNLQARYYWSCDREGRACFKPFTGENMHGPARMFVEEGVHYADQVLAHRCRGLPLFATEWITRTRTYDWPSPQLIDEIKMMGCLFVGVGHFASPEKELEWRISFSLQERRLMKSLNPVQHKVYILLKMVKKNVLEKCLNVESLSSYHCKTCVFHMTETSPASMWVPENLISCLLQCLVLLLRWLREKFCPSFFLKDQNLFDKEGFLGLVGPLEKLIDLLLQTGHQFIYLLQSDRVGEMLRDGDLRWYKSVSDVKIGTFFNLIKLRTILLTLKMCRLFFLRFTKQDALSFYMTNLEKVHHNYVDGATDEDTRGASRIMMPWLHLSIGLEYASRAITCQDRHESNELMKKVDYHLQQARNTDLVNVRLAQASVLLKLERLEACFMLLREIENSWTYNVVSICCCINSHTGQHEREVCETWREKSLRKLLKKYVASCVIFQPSQVELVPPPLRYEMYRSMDTPPGSRNEKKDVWFDLVAVDAKVYLYLLQYLVCSKLNREPHKQIALDSLVSLTQHDAFKHIAHKETVFNVLGWIYLQEHRVDDAIGCFNISWQIRPQHNAAKFHVLELCTRMAAERAGQQDNPLG